MRDVYVWPVHRHLCTALKDQKTVIHDVWFHGECKTGVTTTCLRCGQTFRYQKAIPAHREPVRDA